MKKLINDPERLVQEELEGYVAAYYDQVALVDGRMVVRAVPKEAGKVAIVMGNGAGHEPAMIGLVGKGLLDVNVPGEIFTAPMALATLEGIRYAQREAGVLLYVANHPGDVINAELAVSMAQAEGIRVDSVVLWDDIASAPSEEPEERRGIAGQTFAFKIAGAAAEEGLSLADVKRVAEKARDHTRTLAVALSSATHPVTGNSMFDLPEDEIEVGMGVHGEEGTGRRKMGPADEIVDEMMARILADRPYIAGETVSVLINGMGSTTLMERFIVFRRVKQVLDAAGIALYHSRIDNVITSQEMAGLSISLCAMDDELKRLWDAPANCPYFTVC